MNWKELTVRDVVLFSRDVPLEGPLAASPGDGGPPI
jgi:hypothetical protein